MRQINECRSDRTTENPHGFGQPLPRLWRRRVGAGVLAGTMALISALLPTGCAKRLAAKARLDLATGAATPYVIALADSASAPEKTAAADLAAYLKKMTGAEFAIVAPAAAAGRPVIAVGPGAAKAIAPDLDLGKTGDKGLGEDGIVLKSVPPHLVLTGAAGAKRGTLYAVYEFLEREVGVRWWTQTAGFVPAKPVLTVSRLDTRYRPVFDYREAAYSRLTGQTAKGWVFFSDAERARFLVRQRFNGHFNGIPADWGGSYHLIGWCHTFNQLLPPAKYFKDHPDWYSEIKGKRTAERSQLCCMNDAMIAELSKNVLERVRQQPEAGIISVAQNDWGGYCECTRCKAMDDAEGSHSGSLLYCVNKVAEAVEKEHPEFLIETLAYRYTRLPPKTVRPRQNVLIRLSVIERSGAQPIDSAMNRALMDDLRRWKEAAPNLFIWDYVANMTGPYAPHPTLPVYAPDLRTYAGNNVRGVFFEGNHYAGAALGDFDELKTYVMSHALWDPQVDEGRVIDEFLNGYYGKAGPVLRQYLELLADKGKGLKLHCWAAGLDAAWLDLAAMNRATALFDQAEAAVAGEPVLRERVRLARLPLDHQWLRGYRLYKTQAGTGGMFSGPTDLTAALEDFLARATSVAGKTIKLDREDYALNLRRRVSMITNPPQLPAALASLPADRVLDIQEGDFTLFPGAKMTEDSTASNGWASRMDPAVVGWTTQIRNLPALGGGGKWHVYASVRVEKIRDTGIALMGGVYDGNSKKNLFGLSVRIEDQGQPQSVDPNVETQQTVTPGKGAGAGEYRLYDLGAHELHDGVCVWFGTTGGVSPESVKAIWIDRVLFVKE